MFSSATSPTTEVARAFTRFLPMHEEHAPHAAIEDELAIAADHVADAARLAAAGDDKGVIAVPLAWAAACALGVWARLVDPEAPSRAKDDALRALDGEIAGCVWEAAGRDAPLLIAAVTAELGPVLTAGENELPDALWAVAVAAALAVEALAVRSRGGAPTQE